MVRQLSNAQQQLNEQLKQQQERTKIKVNKIKPEKVSMENLYPC